jgi:hypothetical protein
MIGAEDICLWSDGTRCYGEELSEYLTFMSDDFEVLPFDTSRYWEFLSDQDYSFGEIDYV